MINSATVAEFWRRQPVLRSEFCIECDRRRCDAGQSDVCPTCKCYACDDTACQVIYHMQKGKYREVCCTVSKAMRMCETADAGRPFLVILENVAEELTASLSTVDSTATTKCLAMAEMSAHVSVRFLLHSAPSSPPRAEFASVSWGPILSLLNFRRAFDLWDALHQGLTAFYTKHSHEESA